MLTAAADQPGVAPAPRPAGAAAPPAEAGQPAILAKEAYLLPPKEIADAVLAARGTRTSPLTNISPDGRKFLIAKTRRAAARRPARLPLRPPRGDGVRPGRVPVARPVGQQRRGVRPVLPGREPHRTRARPRPGARGRQPGLVAGRSQARVLRLLPGRDAHLRRRHRNRRVPKITKTPVLATLVSTLPVVEGRQADSDGAAARRRQAAGAEAGASPPSRKVRVARDGKDPSRTYRYLLESPYRDAAARTPPHGADSRSSTSRDGEVTNVGAPAMIRSVSTAPGESQFRVDDGEEAVLVLTRRSSGSARPKAIWNLRRQVAVHALGPQPPRRRAAAGCGDRTRRSRRAGPGRGEGRRARAAPKRGQPPVEPSPTPRPRSNQPVDPDDRQRSRRSRSTRTASANRLAAGRQGHVVPATRTAKKDEKAKRRESEGRREGRAQGPRDAVAAAVRQGRREGGVRDARTASPACSTPRTAGGSSSRRRWTASGRSPAIDLSDPKKTVRDLEGDRGEPRGTGTAPKKGRRTMDDGQKPMTTIRRRATAAGSGRAARSAALGLMSRSLRRGQASSASPAPARSTCPAPTALGGGGAGDVRQAVHRRDQHQDRQEDSRLRGQGRDAETIDAVDGNDIKRVFTTRQKRDVVPDSYMTELATGKVTKLTNNVDKTPWFHDLKVERFRVTRVDGFKFWVKVTTPAEGDGQAAGAVLDLPARVHRPGRLRRRPDAAGSAAAAAGGRPGRFAAPGAAEHGDPHARSATRSSSRTCRSSARPGG